ncbi:MAG TPA: DUF559 domain-containing protein [Rhizomicrobium sp.]
MVKAHTEQKRDALSRNRSRAKAMRHEPVVTEKLFWSIARNCQLDGLKFKRQVPVGPFIADFLCAEHRLIVELDGPFHSAARDSNRDAYLSERGYRVLRFTNKETASDIATVRAIILNELRARPPHPTLSPNGGEG